MTSRLCSRVLLVLTSVLPASACLNGESAAELSEWSTEATARIHLRRADIISPDGKKIVIIDGVTLAVEVGGRRLPAPESFGLNRLAEVAWSPDSTAFFITESYGGWVGEWILSVYLIENERVRMVDVTQEVVKRFKKHYRCREPQEPNVGAVAWVEGSKKLLVVAEVPPHSNCPEMGKFRGYLVEVPAGRILREYGPRELRARWGHFLGGRFRR